MSVNTDIEKLELSLIDDDIVKWHSHSGKLMVPQNIKESCHITPKRIFAQEN